MVERPDGVERRYLVQFAKSFAPGKGALEIRDEGGKRKGRGAGRWKTLAIVRGGQPGRGHPAPAAERAELTVQLRRGGPESGGPGRPEVSLALTDVEGTLFVRCDKPSPALFGVIPSTAGGNPMMRLEPVV